MATVAQVAKASLQLILVQASEADLEAAEYQDYITSLNQFMHALEADNVILGGGWVDVDDLSDELSVPDGAIEAIVYNMAVRVAPMYGGKVSAALIETARDSMKTLRNLGQSVTTTSYSYSLPIGSGNEVGVSYSEHFYDGVTGQGAGGPYLTRADINTILELNTIVLDATIMVAGDNISNFVNDAGYVTRVSYQQVTNDTSTAYTVLESDLDGLVTTNNASANTVDIDATLNAAAEIGHAFDVMQLGAGQTTITSSAVTLRAKDSGVKVSGQYDVVSCAKISATEWVVIGGTA